MSNANIDSTGNAEIVICGGFRELHLSGMMGAFESQQSQLDKYGGLPFTVRLKELVQAETDLRANNSLKKRLRIAQLPNSCACMENVDTGNGRELNMEQLLKLSQCDYIQAKTHVSLEGATGTGKTYLASALGNAACRNGYRVKYVRMPDLLNELSLARRQCEAPKVRDSYLKYDVLIIDEWLTWPVFYESTLDLLEIVNACLGKSSIIFCSQYPNEEWYKRIDSNRAIGTDSILAESVLDRIVHQMIVLTLSSKSSLRKIYNENGEEKNGKG